MFRSTNSGSMAGTSQWSMNVTHMSNAKKGPTKDFNSYKDFTDVELDAQIITCAMTHFEMKKIEGMYPKLKKKSGL